jgi:arylsulfatase A-like enzyme
VGGIAGQQSVNAATDRPNVILIVADDLDSRSLELMPNIDALLRRQGTEFANFMVSMPVCCPSRASILRGQYVHNHGVLSNRLPNGGFVTFSELGHEASNLATWLHDAGYRTGLFGKYLNDYDEVAPRHVPQGWGEWQAWAGRAKYYGFEHNENGEIVRYRARDGQYETDVLADRARQFIEASIADDAPFFAYIAPHAPHEPNIPALRHETAFADAAPPRLASFNEADVSDKPAWVQAAQPLSPDELAQMDALYQRRLRTMLAVDEMLAELIGALEERGALANTYIMFTSDNGWHFGEHRQAEGKGTPYEEAIRVPLLARGPGVAAGRVEHRVASNIDLAPTIAALVGATAPDFVDGRSLAPLLHGDETAPWRQAVLIEMISWTPDRRAMKEPAAGATAEEEPILAVEDRRGVEWDRTRSPMFRVLRTTDWVYIAYDQSDDRELYDLRTDPYQLDNLIDSADPEALAQLETRIAELADCAAASCHAAEDAALGEAWR